MTRTVRVVHAGGTFFESPRWLGDRWVLSDVYAHRIVTVDPDGAFEVRAALDAKPSGLAVLGQDLLVLLADANALVRLAPDGTTSPHAAFADLARGMSGDLVVHPCGVAYVGHVGFDPLELDLTSGEPLPLAPLVGIRPDGEAFLAADDLALPNGMVVTDAGTLVVGESLAGAFTAFDVRADGSLAHRRSWAPLGAGVAPDGCCLDADGRIWFADAFGARCVLVAEGGQIVEEVPAPIGLQVYACSLGGPEGRHLLLCCAPDFDPVTRAGADDAALAVVEVETPMQALP